MVGQKMKQMFSGKLYRKPEDKINKRRMIMSKNTKYKTIEEEETYTKSGYTSVSQSNKGSSEKSLLKESDMAEDRRKVADVDIMLSLNQTEEEKGIMAKSQCMKITNISILLLS